MNNMLKTMLIAFPLVVVTYHAPIKSQQSDPGIAQTIASVGEFNAIFEQLFSLENTESLKVIVGKLQSSHSKLMQSIALIGDQDMRDILKKFSLKFKKIIDILANYTNAKSGKLLSLLREIKKEGDVKMLFAQAIEEINGVAKKLVQTRSKPLICQGIIKFLDEMKQTAKRWEAKEDKDLVNGLNHTLGLNK